MNLHNALDSEHSKAQALRIVDYIGRSDERFSELLEFVTGENKRLAQRAAWVISHCAMQTPEVVEPHLFDLLQFIRKGEHHDAIKRNTMKAASILELRGRVSGLAADLAFEILSSPDEAIATRAYSLTVLERLCKAEPELAPELRLVMDHMSGPKLPAALKARIRGARKVIDNLSPPT
ncbi:MAG: hypothetical protein MI807_15650 [Verrucomicrobiales bacterium]|nr:hypothetical protein [Verrucomicrobiales bacterium]